MKRLRNLKTKEQLNADFRSKTQSTIHEEVIAFFPNMPKYYSFVVNKNIRILIYLTFFLIIPIIIYLFLSSKIRKYIADNMDADKLFSQSFDAIDEITFDKFENSKGTKDLMIYRNPAIPARATIDKATSTIHLTILGKYKCSLRSGLASWWENNGNNGQRRVEKPTGYIKISGINTFKDFNFSLHKKTLFSHSNDKLESTAFNKAFTLKDNDKIKSRMIFTPLTMEKILDLKKKIIVRDWWLTKTSDEILLKVYPKSWNDFQLNISISKLGDSADSIEKELLDDMFITIWSIYTLLGLILVPPFLD